MLASQNLVSLKFKLYSMLLIKLLKKKNVLEAEASARTTKNLRVTGGVMGPSPTPVAADLAATDPAEDTIASQVAIAKAVNPENRCCPTRPLNGEGTSLFPRLPPPASTPMAPVVVRLDSSMKEVR